MKTYEALTDFWIRHNLVATGERVVLSDAEVKYLKHAVKLVDESGTGPTAPAAAPSEPAKEEPKEEIVMIHRRKKAGEDGAD